MKRHLLGTTLAVICSAGLLAAQSQDAQDRQRNDTPREARATYTVSGCLFEESDVPGRDAGMWASWGIVSEDVLLTNAQVKHGATARSADEAARSGEATGTTGTSGTGTSAVSSNRMFKLDDLSDEQRDYLAGKRVEVVGWFEGDWSPDLTSGTRGTRGTGTTGTGTTGTEAGERGGMTGDDKVRELKVLTIRVLDENCLKR